MSIEKLYSKKVMDHFMHPKNMGKISKPSGVGRVGNPVCGDVMELYLKIGKRKIKGKSENYIQDVRFQTFGCGAAIATSSMITEMIKGKSVAEAEKITNQEVTRKLDGLPPAKRHCSVLAEEALTKALADWRKKSA